MDIDYSFVEFLLFSLGRRLLARDPVPCEKLRRVRPASSRVHPAGRDRRTVGVDGRVPATGDLDDRDHRASRLREVLAKLASCPED